MQQFLDQYGYIALLIGTFFEGETAILIASALIHKGIFTIQHTIAFAFAGSFISDWIYYLVGRLNGKYLIDRRPKLKQMVQPVTTLFMKYQLQLLLSYRFLYGFRVVVPMVIGMSGFKPMNYLFFTIVAGLLWASLVSSVGYAIGSFFVFDAATIERNFFFIVIGCATVGFLIGLTVKRLVGRAA
jgi:membrane protein DedA with SNARE-associated domain